jgi:tetratricopeptide (TPR) repeat protein
MAKVKRKQLLKEPDEFLTLSDKIIRWGRDHLKLVITVVSVLVLITAAILGVRGWMRYHAGQGAELLAQVFHLYEKTASGQAEAAEVDQALKGLNQVVNEYGATPAGLQARLALGSLYLGQEKYDLSRTQFAELVEDPDTPKQLLPLALRGLGNGLEAQQKFAEAAQAYQQALAAAGPGLSQLLMLDRARALAASGDKHAATTIYRELLDKAPGEAIAQEAKDRLVALGEAPQVK